MTGVAAGVTRTDDGAFDHLPDYPFAPHYAVVAMPGGAELRLHYLDEGPRSGPVVVLLHGEPTWSYLYRHVIPGLVAAGCRVVAPDLIGFGRSDKPAAVADYTYDGHEQWLQALLVDQLDLRDVTLFGQDWGGLLGLRLVAFHPERMAAVVLSNTGFPDGAHRLPAEWWRFRDFVAAAAELPVGFLVASGCRTPLPPAVVAAYDAPFTAGGSTAGARAFPDLIPQSADHPATARQQQAWAALQGFDRPVLCAFSDSDPITRGADGPLRAAIPGCADVEHRTIAGAGHFVQEDQPAAVVAAVLDGVRLGRRAP